MTLGGVTDYASAPVNGRCVGVTTQRPLTSCMTVNFRPVSHRLRPASPPQYLHHVAKRLYVLVMRWRTGHADTPAHRV